MSRGMHLEWNSVVAMECNKSRCWTRCCCSLHVGFAVQGRGEWRVVESTRFCTLARVWGHSCNAVFRLIWRQFASQNIGRNEWLKQKTISTFYLLTVPLLCLYATLRSSTFCPRENSRCMPCNLRQMMKFWYKGERPEGLRWRWLPFMC